VAKIWTTKLALELEHMEATLNYKINYMGNRYGQRMVDFWALVETHLYKW